jgi:hypothetical protein
VISATWAAGFLTTPENNKFAGLSKATTNLAKTSSYVAVQWRQEASICGSNMLKATRVWPVKLWSGILLGRSLCPTHDGTVWIMRSVMVIQHIFQIGHECGIGLRRNDKLLLQRGVVQHGEPALLGAWKHGHLLDCHAVTERIDFAG